MNNNNGQQTGDSQIEWACCRTGPEPLSKKQVEQDIQYMNLCLAMISGPCDQSSDVPVAALILHPEQGILAQASNTTLYDHDSSAHAEINAMRKASQVLKNHRLVGCTLYITLEPCLMCFGAIMEARIKRIVYAAADTKLGILSQRRYQGVHKFGNHHFRWTEGVLAEKASAILRTFFRSVCR